MPSKIEHEFQKEIAAFMADEIAKVKVQVRTEGGINPKISLLYRREGVISSMIAPVPGHFLETESGKQYLTEIAIPTLVRIFNSTGATIICLAWITEAWLWKIDNTDNTTYLTSEQIDLAKKN